MLTKDILLITWKEELWSISVSSNSDMYPNLITCIGSQSVKSHILITGFNFNQSMYK